MNRINFFENVLPKKSAIAELGIFLGTLSDLILKVNEPTALFLVDPFCDSVFGCNDCDNKNHVVVNNFQNYYNWLKHKYGYWDNVFLCREYSTDFLDRLPDSILDCVYIDTLHTYEQTKRELELSRRVVQPNGWISGHDMQIEGVAKAVKEFVEANAPATLIITDEALPSYFIRIEK